MKVLVKETEVEGEYVVLLTNFEQGELRELAMLPLNMSLDGYAALDKTGANIAKSIIENIADSLYIAHAVPLNDEEEWV